MPVRKNIKNAISVTGSRVSQKLGRQVWHESTLEGDYLDLLEFDSDVVAFEEQPFTLNYKHGRKSLVHTPDVLVVKRGPDRQRTVLVQVKFRSELFRKWQKFHPGLRAAARYAATRGWASKILTEREIRTPRLYNVQRLLAVRQRELDIREIDFYFSLVERGAHDFGALVSAAEKNGASKSDALATIHTLLARKLLNADLTTLLNSSTQVYI